MQHRYEPSAFRLHAALEGQLEVLARCFFGYAGSASLLSTDQLRKARQPFALLKGQLSDSDVLIDSFMNDVVSCFRVNSEVERL